MNIEIVKLLAIAVTAWVVIFLLRALPFMLFGRKGAEPPKWLAPLEKWISPVTIALLIAYSYYGLFKARPPNAEHLYGFAEVAAGALTVAMHLWRRNSLLSILSGTIFYMVLVA